MHDRWSILQLQNDGLELLVLPGIGGRLWDIKFNGQSLLFQNPDLVGLPVDEIELADLPTRSPQFGFPLWGGEKTWIAPDTAWQNGGPFPALDSAPYQITSKGADHIEMASQICPLSNLSVKRRITQTNGSTFTIEHSVTNHGDAPRPTGIWSVMMIDTPAKICIATEKPALHPVFGDAGPLAAPRQNGLTVDCHEKREFKIGVPNPNGETLIKIGNNGPYLICSTDAPSPDDTFAHQYPVEIFNSGDYDYCEAEWHSPAVELSPGTELLFRQNFEVREEADPRTLDAYGNLL